MKQNAVSRLLSAPGPYHECADKLMLYGQFVGSWDIEAIWYDRNGGRRQGRGEWHFAWILGGLGVQDVLFASGAQPHQFGTTIRCYDRGIDAWHISWMQPGGGEFAHLIGRRTEEGIVQEGLGADPRRLERWSFKDITSDSFLWRGEVSLDEGVTWFLEQEMRATRRDAPRKMRGSADRNRTSKG